MEVLEKHVKLRREMHDFYINFFKDIEGVSVFKEPNADFYSNFWLTCIVFDSDKSGKNREELRIALEVSNIESRPLWKPMHLQPIFEKSHYYGGKVSENLFENGLCLPSGSNLTESDKQRIERVLREFFKKVTL
jgi:dTDP-4-amino-4,6-dideoxygalactose transaminase